MTSKMKTISKRAGAELGQAQLKLGLGFTLTNLYPLATHLLFTAPNNLLIAITNLTLFISI